MHVLGEQHFLTRQPPFGNEPFQRFADSLGVSGDRWRELQQSG